MRCVCNDDELTCWGDCDRLLLPPPGLPSQIDRGGVPAVGVWLVSILGVWVAVLLLWMMLQ